MIQLNCERDVSNERVFEWCTFDDGQFDGTDDRLCRITNRLTVCRCHCVMFGYCIHIFQGADALRMRLTNGIETESLQTT